MQFHLTFGLSFTIQLPVSSLSGGGGVGGGGWGWGEYSNCILEKPAPPSQLHAEKGNVLPPNTSFLVFPFGLCIAHNGFQNNLEMLWY